MKVATKKLRLILKKPIDEFSDKISEDAIKLRLI